MGHALPASPELLNDPFLHATTLQRYATVAYAMLRYLGLLVFPHPLTHDYYFDHIPIVDGGHPVAIASVILHAALGWWAWGRLRARDPIAYGVWFYLIALSIVSNLVVSVGVILSERFLYTPSVGFAIAVGHAAHRLERRAWVSGRRWISVATALALGGVMAAFAGATIARNPAWHDDLTLFRTDVRTSANSTKCQTGAGGTLIDAAGRSGDEATRKRFLVEAIVHLRRAVEIYPGHGEAWLLLGNAYAMTESTRAAISCYRQAVASWPGLNQARANLGAALLQEGSYAEAARAYQVLVEREPNNAQAWCGLGQAQEELGNRESAVSSFERAVAVDSTDAKALAKLGTAYGRFRGDLGRARRYLDQAIQKGNREEWVYDNLGVALGSMGRYQEAIRVLDEGLRYHPDSRKLEMSLATTFHLMGDERTSQAHWARAQAAQGKAP
jgi:tetratricopeptide (TPR) repeat protein